MFLNSYCFYLLHLLMKDLLIIYLVLHSNLMMILILISYLHVHASSYLLLSSLSLSLFSVSPSLILTSPTLRLIRSIIRLIHRILVCSGSFLPMIFRIIICSFCVVYHLSFSLVAYQGYREVYLSSSNLPIIEPFQISHTFIIAILLLGRFCSLNNQLEHISLY